MFLKNGSSLMNSRLSVFLFSNFRQIHLTQSMIVAVSANTCAAGIAPRSV